MGLRERLATLFACRCDPVWTDRRLHAPECVEELQDDVAEIAVAWLRDEAADYQKRADQAESSTLMTMLTIRADTLSKLADSITGSTDADPGRERLGGGS